MSDTENRKSMDDVLASIRKIVRAEKDPESVQEAEAVPTETSPLSGNAGMADESAAPLALTPDMLMADDAAETVEAVAEPMAEASEAVETVQETASEAMGIDPDTIRGMVREVVMEQLKGPDADGLIRNIIRAELTTGDVGANISKNVLRLIRTEVGNALGK